MKLNITFKNVGQGDTIFLDWQETNSRKFALIDCNMIDKGIHPVIEHIKKEKIREFEFMVMSHPHSDHFSGFPDLFNYCEANRIRIKTFYHTSGFDPVRLTGLFDDELEDRFDEVITSTVNRRIHKELLRRLYKRLDEQNKLRPNGFIDDIFFIANNYPIRLTHDIDLVFRSPYQHREIDRYIRSTFRIDEDEQHFILRKVENNPKANYLSSLIQISHQAGWQVLLCSDVTEETLKLIMNNPNDMRAVTQKKLLAAQIPHHGSIRNHVEEFWKQCRGLNKADIIISVGERYNHPNVQVVNFFKDQCKSIHATNFVGGYEEAFNPVPITLESKRQRSIRQSPISRSREATTQRKPSAGQPNCGEKTIAISIGKNGRPTWKIKDGPPY